MNLVELRELRRVLVRELVEDELVFFKGIMGNEFNQTYCAIFDNLKLARIFT